MTPGELSAFGEKYLQALKDLRDSAGFETFIISNEGLWGKSRALQPFFEALMKEADLVFVGYLRNAAGWLPSAYAQWGINHKIYNGPVRPFASRAPHLIKSYREALLWDNKYGDRLTLRHFDGIDDVFSDFLKVIDVALDVPKLRLNERRSDAQLILRLLFNKRRDEPMDPAEFNRVVQSRTNRVTRLDSIVNEFFDYSVLPAVIAQEKDVFQKIGERFGIDLVGAAPGGRIKKAPEIDALRDDILDYLLEAFITLTERVDTLEAAVLRSAPSAKTGTGT